MLYKVFGFWVLLVGVLCLKAFFFQLVGWAVCVKIYSKSWCAGAEKLLKGGVELMSCDEEMCLMDEQVTGDVC